MSCNGIDHNEHGNEDEAGDDRRDKAAGSKELNIIDIISKKRDGHALTKDEINFFVEGAVQHSIQDSQLGAMLMAIYHNRLNDEETTYLTRAMTASGEILEWPKSWKGKIVDKHSTGGVGDKVSLILAPALAACGMKVPMVSGRGLGHTGGTLDKLEAIPGFKVSLSQSEMTSVLEEVGCCIVGQTSNLVPADKIMYATRDVTATVANIGLITSSIVSKKAAESLDVLVLDVKFGRGAFCQSEAEARELARSMVKAGNGSGIQHTVALLTSMDTPIGHMIGNSLEVAESISCLHGNGPDDLRDLVVKLGGHVLYEAGTVPSVQEGLDMLNATLHDGTAVERFAAMIKAQGVQPELADKLCVRFADVMSILPKSKYNTEIKCPYSGIVDDIDSMKCAMVSWKLGAGRTKAGDSINHAVGLELTTAVGRRVRKGNVWVIVHHDKKKVSSDLLDMLNAALTVNPVSEATRVIDVIKES